MNATKKVVTMVSNPTPALVAEAPLLEVVAAGALVPVVTAAVVPVGVEVTVGTLVVLSDVVTAAAEEDVAVAVLLPEAVALAPVAIVIDDTPDPAHAWL